MRLNLKRLIMICIGVGFLWLLFTIVNMKLPKNVPLDKNGSVKNRIYNLEERMNSQLEESRQLLTKVKQHLRNQTTLSSNEGHPDPNSAVLPVLVISCDRVTVRRCLDKLISYRPNKEVFPIIVSQDCGHNETYWTIREFVDRDSTVSVVQQPDLSEITLPKAMVKFRGYYKIARHYRFALNHVFKTLAYDAVIIVEDDLDISKDFFEYFLGTYALLLSDPSIWCISAWNDNGKENIIDNSHPELLHRTDFFPGLGWMMRRHSWLDLEPHWPLSFFDDWLRNQENTGGRSCIRPEISRTYSFGKVGVSRGLFFDKHLRYIMLNTDYVPFTKMNLTYLLKDNYDTRLESMVASLPLYSADDVATLAATEPQAIRVQYSDARSYRLAAKKLGLMDDFRSGIPRTGYRGIVTCFINGRRVYLAPSFPWNRYDPSWG